MFWMLHVSREDPQHPGKRINKVKDIVDILISNFQQSFTPGRNLAVDETMVGFRGRFGAKQYMPAKPTKHGIKAFTCADSELSYVLNFLVYTGGDILEIASSIYSTLSQPARIVLHLLEPYLGKDHTVFTDRYYTNLPLAITLGECNYTSFIGTAIKNRVDLPDAIRSPSFHLENDETLAFRCDKLLALGWRGAQEKKGLIMLSSESSARSVMVQSQATGRTSLKPKVVRLWMSTTSR